MLNNRLAPSPGVGAFPWEILDPPLIKATVLLLNYAGMHLVHQRQSKFANPQLQRIVEPSHFWIRCQ